MQAGWRRRGVMAGGGSLIAALFAPRASALPAGQDLRRLIENGIPAELRSVLPEEAFEAAGFVQTLLALESEAKALRLPRSVLSLHEGEVPTDPERLYELVLPRLVALVDRAERRNPGFADKSGALLARLHRTQHVAAEGFLVESEQVVPLGFAAQAAPGPLALPATAELPTPPVPAVPEALARSLKFDDLAAEYAAFYAALEIRPQHRESAEWHRTMMLQSRGRYEGAGKRTGVPWYFIAAVHGLEASFNFRAHFHNGDFPLHQRTRQVPAGRPRVWLPPSDWESSTVDALRLMGFADQDDWSLPRLLYRIEAFNGFGYRRMGRATPYLWCFSSHYERGKYVADGRFDPRARSQQCGAAVMFKLLEEAGTVSFR